MKEKQMKVAGTNNNKENNDKATKVCAKESEEANDLNRNNAERRAM